MYLDHLQMVNDTLCYLYLYSSSFEFMLTLCTRKKVFKRNPSPI